MDKKVELKEVYEQLKAPEELKTKTLEMMSDVQRGGKKKNYFYPAMAMTACAAILCLVLFWPRGIKYITPVEDGNYYEEVSIKDGVIIFNQNRVAISITPNAGKVVIGGETKTEEETVISTISEKQSESGGDLVFQEVSALSLPEIREDAWSNIGEQQIYVTVLKAEDYRYQAAFEKDGIAYEVIGTGVTQKEFIDFLYAQIK